MKTTAIDVRDLLSPLSARGVEKQLAKSARDKAGRSKQRFG